MEHDHDEELISCLYESFCMEYEPISNAFAFDDQCNDSLHASILRSISSLPSPFHEATPTMPSSSSLELKPLSNTLKYALLCANKSFPVIIANDLNPDQENPSA